MYFYPRVQFLGAITTPWAFGWSLQGFHRRCSRAPCGLARLRHQQASRAAHLVRGRLRVHPAAVPSVGAQDGGESLQRAWSCRGDSRFEIGGGCYHGTLSVAAFAETWDITCPCAPVIFAIITGPSGTASLS